MRCACFHQPHSPSRHLFPIILRGWSTDNPMKGTRVLGIDVFSDVTSLLVYEDTFADVEGGEEEVVLGGLGG